MRGSLVTGAALVLGFWQLGCADSTPADASDPDAGESSAADSAEVGTSGGGSGDTTGASGDTASGGAAGSDTAGSGAAGSDTADSGAAGSDTAVSGSDGAGTGSGGTSAAGTGSGGTGSSGTGGTALTPTPDKHRTQSAQCDGRPPPDADPPTPSDPTGCQIDADCTNGVNGQCVFGRFQYCAYDACFDDGDCDASQACMCDAPGGGHQCLGGNCQVDADCPGSYCSPSFGTCGNYSGVIGYYCHTPEDECTDDADCSDSGTGGFGLPYCMFEPTLGRWVCNDTQCVG